jgi:hypothetical protein
LYGIPEVIPANASVGRSAYRGAAARAPHVVTSLLTAQITSLANHDYRPARLIGTLCNFAANHRHVPVNVIFTDDIVTAGT